MPATTATTPGRTTEAEDTLSLLRRTFEQGWTPTRNNKTWPIYPAGIDLAAAEALHQLALDTHATRTLETGLGVGISALALAAAAHSNAQNHDTPVHTAIDPATHWCGHAGLELINRSPVAHIFRHLDEPSLTALPRLLLAGERFDLAFIDGAHHFETALLDAIYAMMMLPPGARCVLDDAQMPPVRLAIDYLTTNLGVRTLPTPHRSLVVLERPERFPPKREWDHFVPFAATPATGGDA